MQSSGNWRTNKFPGSLDRMSRREGMGVPAREKVDEAAQRDGLLRRQGNSADAGAGGYRSVKLFAIKGFPRDSQVQLEVWPAGVPPPPVFAKERVIHRK